MTVAATSTIALLRTEWTDRYVSLSHDFPGIGTRLCGELELELRAAGKAEQDRLLHALLVAASEGDSVAERVLLNHMTPKAHHLARSCAALRSYSYGDAIATSIGAVWEAIKEYPLHRDTSVHGNIGLNALSIITRTLGSGLRKGSEEMPTSDYELEAAIDSQGTSHLEPVWGDDSFHDLVTVLSWAVDTDVLSRDDVALLARFDLGDQDDRQALADERSLNRDSLNRRVLRIRNVLVEAVREHVRANGSW